MLPTRITHLSRLYHHRDGENPTDCSAGWCERLVPSRARPVVADLELGPDWTPLPAGAALLQIANPRPPRQTIPTPEERAAEDAHVVLVAAGAPPVPFARVRPDEFLPAFEPLANQSYSARTLAPAGRTLVTVTTIPA